METQTVKLTVPKEKIIRIAILIVVACAIILFGAGFGAYCALNQVSYSVLTARIPGYAFGLIIAALGIRYLFSIYKRVKKGF